MTSKHGESLQNAAEHPEEIQDWSPEEIAYIQEQEAKAKARFMFGSTLSEDEFEELWKKSVRLVDDIYEYRETASMPEVKWTKL